MSKLLYKPIIWLCKYKADTLLKSEILIKIICVKHINTINLKYPKLR